MRRLSSSFSETPNSEQLGTGFPGNGHVPRQVPVDSVLRPEPIALLEGQHVRRSVFAPVLGVEGADETVPAEEEGQLPAVLSDLFQDRQSVRPGALQPVRSSIPSTEISTAFIGGFPSSSDIRSAYGSVRPKCGVKVFRMVSRSRKVRSDLASWPWENLSMMRSRMACSSRAMVGFLRDLVAASTASASITTAASRLAGG